MSEFDNYDSDNQIEESDTRNPLRARMKQLEKENAEAKKLLAEADVAKRELAFVRAGLDPLSAKHMTVTLTQKQSIRLL